MAHSRFHREIGAPRKDTPEAIAWRRIQRIGAEMARLETAQEFPTISTPELAEAALEFQEDRLRFWMGEIESGDPGVCEAGNPTLGALPCGDPGCVCASRIEGLPEKVEEIARILSALPARPKRKPPGFKEGDRVRFLEPSRAEAGQLGTVIEAGYSAVKIRWDDGAISLLRFQDPAIDSIEAAGGPSSIQKGGPR